MELEKIVKVLLIIREEKLDELSWSTLIIEIAKQLDTEEQNKFFNLLYGE